MDFKFHSVEPLYVLMNDLNVRARVALVLDLSGCLWLAAMHILVCFIIKGKHLLDTHCLWLLVCRSDSTKALLIGVCVCEWKRESVWGSRGISPAGSLGLQTLYIRIDGGNEWRSAGNLFEPFRRLRASMFVRDRPTVSSSPIKIFPLKYLRPSCYSADRQLHFLNPPCLCSARLCVKKSVSLISQPQYSCQWPLWGP